MNTFDNLERTVHAHEGMDTETLTDIETESLHRVAFHEAGHYVVSENYKLKPFAFVVKQSEPEYKGQVDGKKGGAEYAGTLNAWTGLNANRKTDNAFHQAVIGWAGSVGEWVLYPEATLTDIYESVMNKPDESDYKHVTAVPPEQRMGALKVAVSIVKRNTKLLGKIAEHLINNQGGYSTEHHETNTGQTIQGR